jgi:hypothetical protein
MLQLIHREIVQPALLNSVGEEIAGFYKPGETALHKDNRWPERSEYAHTDAAPER